MSIASIIFFIAGLAILVVGADVLVRGASRLALAFGISPLVVGLTIVAYGTSAPELAVSLQAALAGQPDMAVGNVIGSNISNILLILGLSALAAPLIVSRQLVRLDVPIMLALSLALLLMALDGAVSRLDGAILFSIALIYSTYLIKKSRSEGKKLEAQYEKEFGPQSKDSRSWKAIALDLAFIAIGIGGLTLGARWLVASAVEFARYFGISELIIGLTIVAVGTSLPELATSIVAALKGERDIAVGNVVGSNIFNIVSVIGITALAVPGGLLVSAAALAFDLPVMIAVAVACLPIFFVGYRINRWEGLLFVFYYAAYIIYLVLHATDHAAHTLFGSVMALFVIPLTVLTLIVVTVRAIRAEAR